jgi:hypothetical protein
VCVLKKYQSLLWRFSVNENRELTPQGWCYLFFRPDR